MMHKPKLLLLLAWVQVVIANGQIQQKRWYQFKPNSIVTNAINHPTSGPVLAQAIHSTSFSSYKGYNAAWDNQGQLIFYAISSDGRAGIYDKFGNVKLQFTDSNGIKEIPIIKLGCGDKYHIILNGKICEYDVINEICYPIIVNANNVVVPQVNFGSNQNTQQFGVAIGITLLSDYAYNLYTLEANQVGQFSRKIQHHTISFDGNLWSGLQPISTADISTVLINGNTVGTTISRTTAVLEVSPNKQFVAVATDRAIIVNNLLPNGSLGTLKYAFSIGSSELDVTYKIAGLEFTNDNKLVFSRYKWQIGVPPEANAVGVVDLTLATPSVSYIGGTTDYSRSEIELASNGKLYITSATQLAEVNATNLTVTNKLATAFYLNSEYLDANEDCRVRTLPDQIDGIPNFDGVPNLLTEYTTIGNETWTNNSNPIGIISAGQSLTIRNYLIVNHDLTISGMNLDFFTNAYINVNNGATLRINSSNLRAWSCSNKMWRGIRVIGTGRLFINDNMITDPPSSARSSIKDAIQAISSSGKNAIIRVRYTDFDKNGNHISLTQTETGPQFFNSTFESRNPLLNKDISSRGYNVQGNWYCKDGVILNFCSAPNAITFTNCVFNITNTGIFVIQSKLSVESSSFSFGVGVHQGVAIRANQNNSAVNTGLLIQRSNFTSIHKALFAQRSPNITFLNNIVHNTTDNAVDLVNNRNSVIRIESNTFRFCQKNAVAFFNNGGPNSQASVSQNSFLGRGPSTDPFIQYTGITINETALSVSNSFGKVPRSLQVRNNTMENMSYGIRINNIRGDQGNPANPVIINPEPLVTARFQNNQIQYEATNNITNNDFNSGIVATSCDGITIVSNTISRNSKTARRADRNRGIAAEGVSNTLIRLNTLTAGRGLAGQGLNLGSNYLCNSFNENVEGISLQDHFLRNANEIHGVLTKDSRPNTFVNTSSANDIILRTSGANITARVMAMNSMIPRNMWLFDPTPASLRYVPFPNPTSSIFAGRAPSPCNNNLPKDADSLGSSGMVDSIYQNLPGIQWQYAYMKEQMLYLNGQQSNSEMHNLIRIAEAIESGNDSLAAQLLSGFVTTNPIAQRYISIYALHVAINTPEYREPTEGELSELALIAQLNPSIDGYAVLLARAWLWHYTHQTYNNSELLTDPIVVPVSFTCLDSFPENNITLQILSDTQDTLTTLLQASIDPQGAVYIPSFILENPELNITGRFYFQVVYNNTEYTTVSRTLAEWRLGTTDVIDLCAMQKTMPTSLQQQYATEQGSTVSIYPNPAQQQFYVRGNLPANSSITLTDITGAVVLKQNVVAGQPIAIDSQAKGLFLYQIYNEQQQLLHYGKLVVH